MTKWLWVGVLLLALAAPAWAADSQQLLRQGALAPGTGVIRDANGNRVGTVEQFGGERVIRDANGNRIGTVDRSGVMRDKSGNWVGTIQPR